MIKLNERLEIRGLQQPKDFNDYASLAIRRGKEAREFSPSIQDKIGARFKDEAIINFIADVHAGHPTSHIDRLQAELQAIRENPKSAVIFGGDLIEGVHWGGASMEQIMSLDEQKGFLKEMFRSMRGHTIGAVSGEHDSKWAAKTGADPYTDFQELSGGGYKRGLMEVRIEAGGEEYDILVAHKLRGSSIYNNLHPTMRASKEIQGYDGYLAGHTHRKAVGVQPVRDKDGSKSVAFGISGPYKETDEYTQRSGWMEQKTKQLFGLAIRLNPDERAIEISDDIVRANREWA